MILIGKSKYHDTPQIRFRKKNDEVSHGIFESLIFHMNP